MAVWCDGSVCVSTNVAAHCKNLVSAGAAHYALHRNNEYLAQAINLVLSFPFPVLKPHFNRSKPHVVTHVTVRCNSKPATFSPHTKFLIIFAIKLLISLHEVGRFGFTTDMSIALWRYELHHLCRVILVVVRNCTMFYDLPVCHIGEVWSSHVGVFQVSIFPTFRNVMSYLSLIAIIPAAIICSPLNTEKKKILLNVGNDPATRRNMLEDSNPLSYLLYRVIHKSVKHFKNSQQIDYATDHGNSYVDRERNCLSFL